MNAPEGRSSNRPHVTAPSTLLWLSMIVAISMVPHSVLAEDKASAVAANPLDSKPAAPVRSSGVSAPAGSKPILLVRPSAVPLGDNSVISVSPQEARQELQGIESGLFRRSLGEPKVLSVPEQGGWVRGFFKEPKASKLWSFFNPKAPLDSETDLMRSARIFGIRGDAPLPNSLQDPIRVEPVGIRFWQINK